MSTAVDVDELIGSHAISRDMDAIGITTGRVKTRL